MKISKFQFSFKSLLIVLISVAIFTGCKDRREIRNFVIAELNDYSKKNIQPYWNKKIQDEIAAADSIDNVKSYYNSRKGDKAINNYVQYEMPKIRDHLIDNGLDPHIYRDAHDEIRDKVVDKLKVNINDALNLAIQEENKLWRATLTTARESISRFLDNSNIQPKEFQKFIRIMALKSLENMSSKEVLSFGSAAQKLTEDDEIFKLFASFTGPHFQKILQALAREPGLNPQFAKILQSLEENGHFEGPQPYKHTLEKELGRADGNTFGNKARINLDRPLGLGTIAVTFPGEVLGEHSQSTEQVFRVLRPNIRRRIEAEYLMTKATVDSIESDPEFEGTLFENFGQILESTHRAIMDELNFDNTRKMQHIAAFVYRNKEFIAEFGRGQASDIKVPELNRDYASDSLIVMERVDGLHFDEFFFKYPHLKNQVVLDLAMYWMREAFFLSGLHHADPHFGNLRFKMLSNGRVQIQLLDFGLAKKVDIQKRAVLLRLAIALKFKDQSTIKALTQSPDLAVTSVEDIEALALAERAVKDNLNLDSYLGHLTAYGVTLLDHIVSFQRGATLTKTMIKNAGMDAIEFDKLSTEMAHKFLLAQVKQWVLTGERVRAPLSTQEALTVIFDYLKLDKASIEQRTNELLDSFSLPALVPRALVNQVIKELLKVDSEILAAEMVKTMGNTRNAAMAFMSLKGKTKELIEQSKQKQADKTSLKGEALNQLGNKIGEVFGFKSERASDRGDQQADACVEALQGRRSE